MSEFGRHQSAGKSLKRSLQYLLSVNGVSKVILGQAKGVSHCFQPGYVKFRHELPGGIKVTGYTEKGLIDIYIKIDTIDKSKIVKIIKDKWNK